MNMAFAFSLARICFSRQDDFVGAIKCLSALSVYILNCMSVSLYLLYAMTIKLNLISSNLIW